MSEYGLWSLKLSPLWKARFHSCKEMKLGEGVLVTPHFEKFAIYSNYVTFKSFCKGHKPSYSTMSLNNLPFPLLHTVANDWKKYTMLNGPAGGSFAYSIYATLIIITMNFVILLFLTILQFVSYNNRQHRYFTGLAKFASLLYTVTFTVYFTVAVKCVIDEEKMYGAVTTKQVVQSLSHHYAFVIVNYISGFLFQICQVLIITRLFNRVTEKRIVFLVGMLITWISNVFWAISTFSTDRFLTLGFGKTLSPFVFLFRIALSASYATIIITYLIRKRKLCYQNLQMAIMTLLTAIVVSLRLAFFFLVLSRVIAMYAGEIFNTTAYLGSTVITWELLNRLAVLEKKEQTCGILGEETYDDENLGDSTMPDISNISKRLRHSKNQNKFWNGIDDNESVLEQVFELENNSFSKEGISSIELSSEEYSEQKSQNIIPSIRVQYTFKERLWKHMKYAYKKFIFYTDYVILRSFNSDAEKSFSEYNTNTITYNEMKVRQRINLESESDVHVYNLKQIEFESDTETLS